MTTTPEFPFADRLPPEAQNVVTDYKNFYERNKPAIILGVATIVLYKVEKRMVKKVVTKALRQEMPQIVRDEVIGVVITDKFGVIGTLAQAVKS